MSDRGRSVVHLPLGAGDSEAAHLEFQHGDDRQIVLTLGNGLSLTLKDDDPVVDLDVDGGKAKLTIARDGTVTVKGQGDVTMEAGGDMTIKAGGTMTIQGAKVNIN